MPLRSRTFLLRLALIALLAMLASALLPSAATLAGARGQFAYMLPGDICSASGHVQLPDDDPTGGVKACAFCHLHAEVPVLPSPLGTFAVLLAPARWHGAIALPAPPPAVSWLAAAPRGPPLAF